MQEEVNKKICTICKISKNRDSFGNDKCNPDGKNRHCKECTKIYRQANKEKQVQYYRENRVVIVEQVRVNSLKNKDKIGKKKRVYVLKNKDKIDGYQKQYRSKNKEKAKINAKKWRANNPGEVLAHNAKRRADKLCATPKWLSADQLNEIKEIYKNCPSGHHVDHIIPLKGKTVRGLHVPWNLQYLTATENLKKRNKLIS